MSRFVESSTQGWGSRIVGSIMGVFFGILLFFGSFVVLFLNEGRVDMSRVAAESVEAGSQGEGKLVFLTAKLSTSDELGDTYLKPGPYLALERKVEMYAWVEKKSSSSKKNIGGSETTETVYDYSTEWTSNPESSSKFKYPEGHSNPSLSISGQELKAKSMSIGDYTLQPQNLSLPSGRAITLNSSNVLTEGGMQLAGEYLFSGRGSLASPEVGDIRISYTALESPVEQATVFGKQEGKFLNPFYHEKKEVTLYRAFEGSRDQAIATLKTEHRVMGWILRFVGFLMMWIGLSALFGPISTFLDVLPFLGRISRGFIGFITLIISLVLTTVTVIVSMILHNIFALIAIALLGLGGLMLYLRSKRGK